MTGGADLAAEVERLETLDLEALRALWRQHGGSRLRPALAGAAAAAARLAAAGRGPGRPRSRDPAPAPPARAGCRPRASSSGSARGCAGSGAAGPSRWWSRRTGFRWEERLYPSLSAAATAIAGTRWNGPRFFGLRRPGR